MIVHIDVNSKTKRRNVEKVRQAHLDNLTKARAIAMIFPTRFRADAIQAIMKGIK